MSEDTGRLIGSYGKGNPVLVFLGGIHGNEPAGVRAFMRVLTVLEQKQPKIKGKVIGLRGNRKAYAQKKRFIDQDLNRLWGEENVKRIVAMSPAERNSEEEELIELLDIFERRLPTDVNQLIFVDLHTTSGTGGFFSIITQNPKNRELAEHIKAPIIFNLVDKLQVTISNYFDRQGIQSLTFEAGQHDDTQSVDLHEAAIWVLLEACNRLDSHDIPDFQHYKDRLAQAGTQLPNYLDFCYRHPVSIEDEFSMNPGYQNFSRIDKGEVLAQDKNGHVYAPTDGVMLMPLYQKQGGDGFYITKELKQAPI